MGFARSRRLPSDGVIPTEGHLKPGRPRRGGEAGQAEARAGADPELAKDAASTRATSKTLAGGGQRADCQAKFEAF